MNKDKIEGTTREALGKLKEVTGKAFGDKKLTANGIAEKTAGKVQKAIGTIKDLPKR